MNLHFCKVVAPNAARLEAPTTTDKELGLYCESFSLGLNWDILPGSKWPLAVIVWLTRFCA
jgi:hypothetical protein